jgi:hypothetical protein
MNLNESWKKRNFGVLARAQKRRKQKEKIAKKASERRKDWGG